jgi:hypothetical protein
MEMILQPLASACAVSKQAFAEGDRIASFLVRLPTLEVARYDVLADRTEGWEAPGSPVCRWTHVFKPRAREENPDRALKLTAENLFLVLADPSAEPTPENTRLLQFLAVLLERKRILRPRGSSPDGSRNLFEHARTKQVYEVPAGELGPEFFLSVQQQLSVLVGEPKPRPEPAAAAPATA